MALFISFEGVEGSGKSTQAALLQSKLAEQGYGVVLVREPGSTPLGERLRPLLKRVGLSPRAELFLFAAARAQLVATVIKPSRSAGKIVIADRYADSTTAYQGYGRELPLSLVRAINLAATEDLTPDITFLLDLPVDEGLRRVGPQLALALEAEPRAGPSRPAEGDQARFEQESPTFHRRVRSGYLQLAHQEPHRVFVLNGSQPPEAIASAVWERVQPLLPSH